jgi:hypothetical protein
VRKLTVGVGGVTKLSRSVPDQVQRPSKELVHHHVEELVDGSILNSLSELGLSESGNANINTAQSDALEDLLDTLDLLILLDGGVAQLGSSSGDKDLVSGHVSSGGVVLTVRDSPRVVRDKEDRVQDPSDKVVDALAGRVRLVTTLVTTSQSSPQRNAHEYSRNDPETGTEETSDEGVGSVKGYLGSGESDGA